MRLFVAVFPPLPVRRDIAATLADLPALAGLRITRAENLHFTVAFLGQRASSAIAGKRGSDTARSAAVSGWLDVLAESRSE